MSQIKAALDRLIRFERRDLVQFGANVGLRGISLAAQFFLLLLLAHGLSPAAFGTFTLIQTIVIFSILLLGYEFSAFSRREIVLAQTPLLRAVHVRDQLLLAAVLGLGALPIAFGAAFAHLFPLELVPAVAGLIWLGLLTQEGVRILYALERVAMANVVGFARSAAWFVVPLALVIWAPDTVRLPLMLDAWLVACVIALAILVWSLNGLAFRQALRSPIEWKWFAQGFRVASPFLVSTLFTSALGYLPRFVLFYARGDAEVGLFGLYSAVTTSIVSLLSTITIPAGMTRAVHKFANDGEAAFRQEMRDFWIGSMAFVAVISVAVIIVFPIIRPFIGKSAYPMDWALLLLLVLANAAQVATLVGQTSLYAQHKDRSIVRSTICVGIISVPLQYELALHYGARGVALAIALSMALLSLIFWYVDRSPAKR